MVFEFDNNTPIYLQIIENIKMAIISGEFAPGERLPSVRDLAVQTKVNPNTMQKAMVELEDLGLIYTERTNGKFVTKDTSLLQEYKKTYAYKLTLDFIKDIQSIGYTVEEALDYIKDIGGNSECNY